MSRPAVGEPLEARRRRLCISLVARRLALSAGLVVTAFGAVARSASAELVVFTHGKIVKAASHRIAGDRIEIRLDGGGSFTLDRLLVERIEEDEVAREVAEASTQVPPRPSAPVEPSRAAPREPLVPEPASTERAAAPEPPRQNPTPPPPRRHHRHRR